MYKTIFYKDKKHIVQEWFTRRATRERLNVSICEKYKGQVLKKKHLKNWLL